MAGMNPKGNPEIAISGKQGGSSAPSTPGAGGSSAPHGSGGGNPFSGIKDMQHKMAIAGGGGGNPTLPSDIPQGYQAPKVPGGDMIGGMAVTGTSGGSSAPRKN